jgi:hypothetical protein
MLASPNISAQLTFHQTRVGWTNFVGASWVSVTKHHCDGCFHARKGRGDQPGLNDAVVLNPSNGKKFFGIQWVCVGYFFAKTGRNQAGVSHFCKGRAEYQGVSSIRIVT